MSQQPITTDSYSVDFWGVGKKLISIEIPCTSPCLCPQGTLQHLEKDQSSFRVHCSTLSQDQGDRSDFWYLEAHRNGAPAR